MDYIKIGFIKKSHGLKGELKVLPLTETPTRFKGIKHVFLSLNGKMVEESVEYAKVLPDEILLKLEGISDRNSADELHSIYLYVDRDMALPLNDWEFFTQDLEGLKVYFEGNEIGEVIFVFHNGANDNIEVKLPSGKTIFYPFLREYVDKVDLEEGRIDINQYEGFFD